MASRRELFSLRVTTAPSAPPPERMAVGCALTGRVAKRVLLTLILRWLNEGMRPGRSGSGGA